MRPVKADYNIYFPYPKCQTHHRLILWQSLKVLLILYISSGLNHF